MSSLPLTLPVFSRLIGTGSALPQRCVSNADLVAELAARGIESSDDWIVERTGIRQRYLAAPDETTSALGARAATEALKAAGVAASEVVAARKRRGKSGLHRARWWVTPTRGDPRESATESRPPRAVGVRVKRRCKRPPARQVTAAARQTPPGARSRGPVRRPVRTSGPLDVRR